MSLVMSDPTPPSGKDKLREKIQKILDGDYYLIESFESGKLIGKADEIMQLIAQQNQQAVQKARLEEAKWGKMQFSKLDKSHVGRSFYNRNTAFKNYAVKFWNNRIAMITDKFDKRIAVLAAAQSRKDERSE